ncbi:hypothetical protein E2C01_063946 [Portunus trituberculatus]|uniref:Uncharacterized protein n=1 Tax=Portunus trituberculatus TaxID=210409 RepID=A0A5B7HJJ1_PORTR|nr:hypothetical protein [Portunus trituberculatus]
MRRCREWMRQKTMNQNVKREGGRDREEEEEEEEEEEVTCFVGFEQRRGEDRGAPGGCGSG